MDRSAAVRAQVTSRLDWDYGTTNDRIGRLYEKGKNAQWNAATDIHWDIEVEFGRPLVDPAGGSLQLVSDAAPFKREQWSDFQWEFQAWMVSQFLHGEQGALVAAGRLVETVPDVESKLYAANQAADEARHVEVYSRYLHEKLGHAYSVNVGLESLMHDVMTEGRPDFLLLGTQIIIEGIAVAAFRVGSATFHDPLVIEITDLVARDEARHVSFGMFALEGIYPQLTSSELSEREEFVLEAAELMRRRFLLEEIWQRMGVDVHLGVEYASTDPLMIQFRQLAFAKVVSNLHRIGLLTPRVRHHLAALSLLTGQSHDR